MALNIEISGKYRITSDSMQIVIQRKHTVDPTKAPGFNPEKHSAEIREEWRDWKYCGTIEQAATIILRQRIYESDAETLHEVVNEIASFKREIKRLIASEV